MASDFLAWCEGCGEQETEHHQKCIECHNITQKDCTVKRINGGRVVYCPRERVKEETCACVSMRARPSVLFAPEGRHMADSVCFISLTVYVVCVFLSGQDRWACWQRGHLCLALASQHTTLGAEG